MEGEWRFTGFISDKEYGNQWYSDGGVRQTSAFLSRVFMKTRSIEDYEILRKLEPGCLAEIGCEE